MAVPSNKSAAIEQLIDGLNPSGLHRTDSIKMDMCSWCGGEAKSFKDRLSQKEYTISGMCQSCQDSVFKDEDE